MKIDICHVYPITSGTAGTYINSIYNALKSNFKQEIFVNYYYKFDYGKKIFYRYSDLSANIAFFKKHNSIRRVLRFFELVCGLLYIFIYIKRNKVKILNYSLNSDLTIEYIFLKAIKQITKTKIAITCHDVLPFGVNLENIKESRKFKKKKSFFNIAHFLIVHNSNSIEELERYYGIKGKHVILSPFPVMDIKPFYQENSLPHDIINILSGKEFIVSMIGYFRKEKGLNVLLKGWNIFSKNISNVQLILAGHFPDKSIIKDTPHNGTIYFHDGFLEDGAYTELIKKSDVIVMPYLRGTNSGIPSSILSMDTIVITSDINMFKTNPLISEDLMFESNNAQQLAAILQMLYKNSDNIKERIKESNKVKLEKYESDFKRELIASYNTLLNFIEDQP